MGWTLTMMAEKSGETIYGPYPRPNASQSYLLARDEFYRLVTGMMGRDMGSSESRRITMPAEYEWREHWQFVNVLHSVMEYYEGSIRAKFQLDDECDSLTNDETDED